MIVAGWIRGIREVRQVTVPEDEDLVGVQRGPVVTKEQRIITDLPASMWARTLAHQFAVELPIARGAGPCGTSLAGPTGGWWAMRWSRLHLVAPLRRYYATYVPPMRFGAKPGPRGRRAACN